MRTTVKNAMHRQPMRVPKRHLVLNTFLQPPFPEHLQTAIFGMGCFWGAEKRFWELDGVYSTAVGYAGGGLKHPTYAEVCTGDTHHAEVVLVIYNPELVSYDQLLKTFWRGHNPARTLGPSDDSGYQYRSVIFTTSAEQDQAAHDVREHYQNALSGKGRISTEIAPAPTFYYAEEKHQQYFARSGGGYRALAG